MARKEFEVDSDVLLDLISDGFTHKEMAEQLGCSRPTLEKKIARLQKESPVLLNYRTLQTLELTELQHKILSAITDDKIDSAPLRDLVLAYKILKEKEFMVEGKPQEIKGLVHYLIEIERLEQEEKAGNRAAIQKGSEEDVTDAELVEDANLDVVEVELIAGCRPEEIP